MISDTPEPLSGMRLFLAGFALALINFVVVLDMTIANVSLPHIVGGLAVSPTQGTWTITSYAVADAITVPLTGWLSARFGTVRWLLISLFGFGLFSLLCGMARTLELLVVFRIFQGLSGGPLMPLTQTLLMRVFPRDKLQIALALWAMTTVAAPVIGPILGGNISDNWSWPWIFFINLPVVAFAFFLVFQLIRPFETRVEKTRIDLVGLALLVVWVGSFQIMLDTGRDNGWFESGWIVLLGLMAAIGFASFIIWELTDANPIVDIRVFRHRSLAVGSAVVSFTYGAFFVSIVLVPLWLQQVVGYTATEAGHATAVVGIAAIMLAPVAAKLLTVVDMRLTISLAVGWLAVVTLMRSGWTTDADFWTYALPQALQGIGMPFFFIGATALAMSAVPASETASAAGVMSFMRTLSGAVGTAVAVSSWDDASRVSRSELVGNLNGADTLLAALQRSGQSLEQARATLEHIVDAQASTIGASHVYLFSAAAFALSALLVWFAPRPAPGAPIGGGH